LFDHIFNVFFLRCKGTANIQIFGYLILEGNVLFVRFVSEKDIFSQKSITFAFEKQ